MQNPLTIRPSGLSLTVACPGSLKLQASVDPLPETEEEAEGTAAHWVAMRYLAGHGHELPVGAKFVCKGRKWEVDVDMAAGATMYARAVRAPIGLHCILRLEDPVSVPHIHPSLCYGTPDAWCLMENYTFPPEVIAAHAPSIPTKPVKLLRVGYYKYGHRYVEVFENYQLTAYASGIMERLQLTDNDPDLWVELILVQPRCYHREGPVRVWRGPADMLRATLNVAKGRATEALDTNPRTITNDACIDCRARHVCKTLQYSTNAFIEFSTSAEIVEMPPEAIGQELAMVEDAIDRLTARATGLSAHAETLLRQGKTISLYHMAPKQSRRIYREDVNVEEIAGLGDLLGIELRKKQTLKHSLVTPRQAIDLGIDEDVMKKYSYRPPATLKLTRDNSITARKVFSK